MKKFLFCFIIFIFICSLFAQTENDKTLTSFKILNYNRSHYMIDMKLTIAVNEIGNFSIFNIRGQKIMDAQYSAGEHRISLQKSKYGSGLFFYRIKTNSYFKSGKIIMLK